MRLTNYLVGLVASLCVLCASCSNDDNPTIAVQYSNKLTLGTGTNASNTSLTGESDEFRALGGVAVLYWRLESAADYAGDSVSLRIEKRVGDSYTPIGTYSTARSYGHVVVSSVSIANAGVFRATGFLTSTSTDVASKAFTVQW
jgi:hypothetical protein